MANMILQKKIKVFSNQICLNQLIQKKFNVFNHQKFCLTHIFLLDQKFSMIVVLKKFNQKKTQQEIDNEEMKIQDEGVSELEDSPEER